jgi:hypothetical protein
MADASHTSVTYVDDPASTTTPAQHEPHQHHHSHLGHHTGKRLKHFLRPDGRKVHIASSPDEANHIRKKLSTANEKDFDLVIHGSPEHVSFIKQRLEAIPWSN